MTYEEQLNDYRWKALSKKAKDLYNNRCEGCGGTHELQTHHNKYIRNRKAWEYDLSELTVLCKDCHSEYHKNKDELLKIITDRRLFYSYEFGQIVKMIKLVCHIETNHYLTILAFLESIETYDF